MITQNISKIPSVFHGFTVKGPVIVLISSPNSPPIRRIRSSRHDSGSTAKQADLFWCLLGDDNQAIGLIAERASIEIAMDSNDVKTGLFELKFPGIGHYVMVYQGVLRLI